MSGETITLTAPNLSPVETVVSFTYEAPAIQPNVIYQTPESRSTYLMDLDKTGFQPHEFSEAVEQVVAIGYPVDNFRSFTHRTNSSQNGTENHLASWGMGQDNFGDFSIYDLHHRQINQERLTTVAHESAHGNSPHVPENARFFGSEKDRAEATDYIESVTNQSLRTGVWLNGYHEKLASDRSESIATANRLKNTGKIDALTRQSIIEEAEYMMREETWAILNEMAITNRNRLAEVERLQHDKVNYLNTYTLSEGETAAEPVKLLTTANSVGATAQGIDVHLIKLLIGIKSHDDLKAHVKELKRKFYPEAEAMRAEAREWQTNADYEISLFFHGIGSTAITQGTQQAPDIRLILNQTAETGDEDDKLRGKFIGNVSIRPRSSLN